MHPIDIRNVPARFLGTVEHRGPFRAMGEAYGRLSAALGAADLWPQVEGMATVVLADPRVAAPADLRCACGAILPEGTALPAALAPMVLPAGRMAVLELTGPYDRLPEAWHHLVQVWLPASGERMAARPPFEVYLNAPGAVQEAELRTDIHLPLV